MRNIKELSCGLLFLGSLGSPTYTDDLGLSIYGGSREAVELDSNVVALRVGLGTPFTLCSGTLVATNVVLTAKHCVTQALTEEVSCGSDGLSYNGSHVIRIQDPAEIGVYIGTRILFEAEPTARGRTTLTPSGPYLCNEDLALVVLDRAIEDIEPASVRLSSRAQAEGYIRAVGYGQNDQFLPIGTKLYKAGVPVIAQGKGTSKSQTPLGVREFEVGEAICNGDSGGPAFSEKTGAVIGVASRGGACGSDVRHVYTTTTGFEELFDSAFAIAGGHPKLEPEGEWVLPEEGHAMRSGCSSGR